MEERKYTNGERMVGRKESRKNGSEKDW